MKELKKWAALPLLFVGFLSASNNTAKQAPQVRLPQTVEELADIESLLIKEGRKDALIQLHQRIVKEPTLPPHLRIFSCKFLICEWMEQGKYERAIQMVPDFLKLSKQLKPWMSPTTAKAWAGAQVFPMVIARVFGHLGRFREAEKFLRMAEEGLKKVETVGRRLRAVREAWQKMKMWNIPEWLETARERYRRAELVFNFCKAWEKGEFGRMEGFLAGEALLVLGAPGKASEWWRGMARKGVKLRRVGRLEILQATGKGSEPEPGGITGIWLDFEVPEVHPFHSGLWTFVVLRRGEERRIVAIVPPKCNLLRFQRRAQSGGGTCGALACEPGICPKVQDANPYPCGGAKKCEINKCGLGEASAR